MVHRVVVALLRMIFVLFLGLFAPSSLLALSLGASGFALFAAHFFD